MKTGLGGFCRVHPAQPPFLDGSPQQHPGPGLPCPFPGPANPLIARQASARRKALASLSMNAQACEEDWLLQPSPHPCPLHWSFPISQSPKTSFIWKWFLLMFIMSHWLLLQAGGELRAIDQVRGNISSRQLLEPTSHWSPHPPHHLLKHSPHSPVCLLTTPSSVCLPPPTLGSKLLASTPCPLAPLHPTMAICPSVRLSDLSLLFDVQTISCDNHI